MQKGSVILGTRLSMQIDAPWLRRHFLSDLCSPSHEEVSGAAEVESQVSIRLHGMNSDLEFQLQELVCYTQGCQLGLQLPLAHQASLMGPDQTIEDGRMFLWMRPAYCTGCRLSTRACYTLPHTLSSLVLSLPFCSSSLRTSTISTILFFAHSSCILELVFFFIPSQYQLKDSPKVHTTTQNCSLQLERPFSN